MDDIGFTPLERELIRSEFLDRFGGATSIHEGIMIKRWATGPNKGQVKLSKAQQSLLDRGFVTVFEPERGFPRLKFTDTGFAAIKAFVGDGRGLRGEYYEGLKSEVAALP